MRRTKSRRRKRTTPPSGTRRRRSPENTAGRHEQATLERGSIGEFIVMLYRTTAVLAPRNCPGWPPDLFAVAGAILQHTGEYRRVLQPAETPEDPIGDLEDWQEARRAGAEWREALNRSIANGDDFDHLGRALTRSPVRRWWGIVVEHSGISIADVGTYPQLLRALVQLLLAADEACVGIAAAKRTLSTNADGAEDETADAFRAAAEFCLANVNDGRSLCKNVRPEVACVLPKVHTPQSGLTLRSLSHNLALCRSSEVRAFWTIAPEAERRNFTSLNLLLLPWPKEIRTTDFRVVTELPPNVGVLARNALYQEFAPRRVSPRQFALDVENAINEARKRAGEIHGLVFPELSMDIGQYLAVERVAWRNGLLLIAGVQQSRGWRRNLVVMQPLGLLESGSARRSSRGLEDRLGRNRIGQSKHHRWCLDRSQILQYELGGQLPASRRCWEYIDIPARDLNFVSLGTWLTWCTLVCEDLARQDPTAEIIRSVGPNLLIALLMDGPQLRKRWPARYATVLADDPGTSVLTLTSLGMARRSRALEELGTPRNSSETPTVVALWNDRIHGMREIALSGNDDACVLSLVCHTEEEFTADAHTDGINGHFVVYAGHVAFDSCKLRRPGSRG